MYNDNNVKCKVIELSFKDQKNIDWDKLTCIGMVGYNLYLSEIPKKFTVYLTEADDQFNLKWAYVDKDSWQQYKDEEEKEDYE